MLQSPFSFPSRPAALNRRKRSHSSRCSSTTAAVCTNATNSPSTLKTPQTPIQQLVSSDPISCHSLSPTIRSSPPSGTAFPSSSPASSRIDKSKRRCTRGAATAGNSSNATAPGTNNIANSNTPASGTATRITTPVVANDTLLSSPPPRAPRRSYHTPPRTVSRRASLNADMMAETMASVESRLTLLQVRIDGLQSESSQTKQDMSRLLQLTMADLRLVRMMQDDISNDPQVQSRLLPRKNSRDLFSSVCSDFEDDDDDDDDDEAADVDDEEEDEEESRRQVYAQTGYTFETPKDKIY
ncbi:uncharacterized protein LODBEIA_P60010 [Lodderomyces beijingensis]|uniref:Uncharacterized protein n=1 Tax=Lodderomyces beijingensis TaxID=1775926 RepID=A0ABP0ZWZ6_9ASCO